MEQTRDGDERYNYALIRLIVRTVVIAKCCLLTDEHVQIALNEQFMVAELDSHSHPSPAHPSSSHHQHSKSHYDSRHPHHHHHHHPTSPTSGKAENLVLKVLKANPGENRTFGENLIFILNRLSKSYLSGLSRLLPANVVLHHQTVAAKKRPQKISACLY